MSQLERLAMQSRAVAGLHNVPALLAFVDELYDEIVGLRQERDAAQAEVTQIALDTSPAYAQMRDERDSARRERDEAMAKLNELRGA